MNLTPVCQYVVANLCDLCDGLKIHAFLKYIFKKMYDKFIGSYVTSSESETLISAFYNRDLYACALLLREGGLAFG